MKLIFTRGPLLGLRAFFFITLSFSLMVSEQRQHYPQTFHTILTMVTTPLQYIVDWPIRLVSVIEENFVSHRTLVSENTDLHSQQLLLKIQLQKMMMLEQENAQLRVLLKATPRHGSERKSVAQLLAVEGDTFVQEMVIDKGSHDGIYIGQPVLDANGVMGQIIRVTPVTSRVLLLSDVRSATPVVNMRTGLRGVVIGTGGSGFLSLINMPITSDIKAGDILVTSGLGGRYPANYPVGVITSIVHVSGQHFATIMVQPSAHLNRSEQVVLIGSQVEEEKGEHNAN